MSPYRVRLVLFATLCGVLPVTLLVLLYAYFPFDLGLFWALAASSIVAIGFVGSRILEEPVKCAAADFDCILQRKNPPKRSGDLFPDLTRSRNALGRLIQDQDLTRDRLEALLQELSESKDALAQNHRFLSAALESASSGFLLFDEGGRCLHSNSALSSLLGRAHLSAETDQEIGSAIAGLLHEPEEFEGVWRDCLQNREAEQEGEIETENQKSTLVYFTTPILREGVPSGRLWMFQDVTERRRLRTQLDESRRLESLGRLAGGIAHDFNNFLTIITGNLHLLEEREVNVEDLSRLRQASLAAERGADLVRHLMDYSRTSPLNAEELAPNRLVEETLVLLRTSIRPNVQVTLELEEGLWDIDGDHSQLESVLLNLCFNAHDAIEEDQGRIHIRTSNQRFEDELDLMVSSGRRNHDSSQFVTISVEDDGSGIAPGDVSKVFEPFFTTKEADHGTGLGLAMCDGVIRRHGGWITCDSDLGEGTSVTIFLPRSRHSVPMEEPAIETDEPPLQGSGERILLIDDESAIREIISRQLMRSGYRSSAAREGAEALEILAEESGDISAVICDMTMAGMGGEETCSEIRRLYPSIPILICSGQPVVPTDFSDDPRLQPEKILRKPFSPKILLEALSEVLGHLPRSATGIDLGSDQEVETQKNGSHNRT